METVAFGNPVPLVIRGLLVCFIMAMLGVELQGSDQYVFSSLT